MASTTALTEASMQTGPKSSGNKKEASGFYTTRQADDEYKIRGCQDEQDDDAKEMS